MKAQSSPLVGEQVDAEVDAENVALYMAGLLVVSLIWALP
jgi:hypothetical protein